MLRISRWLAAAAVAIPLSSLAQVPPAPPGAPAAETARPAPLVVMNRVIMMFRTSYLGYSPAERAEQAKARIEALLRRSLSDKVTTETVQQGVLVKVDDGLAFMVTAGDADATTGLDAQATAAAAAELLRRAIDETGESRNANALAVATGKAAVGTVIFVAMLWALVWVRRFVSAQTARIAGRQADRLAVGGVRLVESERAEGLIGGLIAAAFWFVALVLAYEWAGRTLELFPYTRPWGERANGFLIATLEGLVTAMLAAVPDLLVALVILCLAWIAAGIATRFFERIERSRTRAGWLDAETARPTRRLINIAIWLIAVVMAYPYLPGANTDAFKGISVLIGLMVSLGGANVVGQALSGLIIMYTRTFRVGEFVRIGDHEGTVTEIGMYQTRLRTGLAEEVVLPNALIVSSVTRNFSRDGPTGFVVQATATIGYDAPWRQVHAMLQEAARRTPGVLQDPAPRVLQVALSDFYVDYRLVAHAKPDGAEPRAELISRLHENIQDVFNENGVQILSPHYLGDPDSPKVVPKAKWYTPPAEEPKR